MTRTRPWNEEAAAGDLFVAVNGGAWDPIDGPEAPDSSYDIEVTLPTGRTVALEVTQDTTQETRRQRAIEGKLDWTSDRLSAWWEVSIVEPCDVKALHAEIFDVISEFDAGGRRSLVISGRPDESSPIHERLRNLGVRLLHRVADADPGLVNISTAAHAGSTGASVLVAIAEDHANRPDNATKLRLANTDERHLWIWVTADRCQQIAALLGDSAPTSDPKVPEHVDAIWITTAYATPTLWSWDRRSGWRRQSAPTSNRQAAEAADESGTITALAT